MALLRLFVLSFMVGAPYQQIFSAEAPVLIKRPLQNLKFCVQIDDMDGRPAQGKVQMNIFLELRVPPLTLTDFADYGLKSRTETRVITLPKPISKVPVEGADEKVSKASTGEENLSETGTACASYSRGEINKTLEKYTLDQVRSLKLLPYPLEIKDLNQTDIAERVVFTGYRVSLGSTDLTTVTLNFRLENSPIENSQKAFQGKNQSITALGLEP